MLDFSYMAVVIHPANIFACISVCAVQTKRMDITPTKLSGDAGISVPYASQIIKGGRVPPKSLAVHIYQRTGWRHHSLADFSDEQIAAFAEMEPWTPPAKQPRPVAA